MKKIKVLHPTAKVPGERIRGDPRWLDRYKSIARTDLFHSLIQVTQYTISEPTRSAADPRWVRSGQVIGIAGGIRTILRWVSGLVKQS